MHFFCLHFSALVLAMFKNFCYKTHKRDTGFIGGLKKREEEMEGVAPSQKGWRKRKAVLLPFSSKTATTKTGGGGGEEEKMSNTATSSNNRTTTTTTLRVQIVEGIQKVVVFFLLFFCFLFIFSGMTILWLGKGTEVALGLGMYPLPTTKSAFRFLLGGGTLFSRISIFHSHGPN